MTGRPSEPIAVGPSCDSPEGGAVQSERGLRVQQAFRSQVELVLPWAGAAASLLSSLVGCLVLVEPIYLAPLLEGLAERFAACRVLRFFRDWSQLACAWPELAARATFGSPPPNTVEKHDAAAAIWSVRSLHNVHASTVPGALRWLPTRREDWARETATRAYACATRALVGLIGDCAEQSTRSDVATRRGAALALGALALVGELETAGVTRARIVAQPGLVRRFLLWVDPDLELYEEDRFSEVDRLHYFTEALNHLRQWRRGVPGAGLLVPGAGADVGLSRLVEAPRAQEEDAFPWEGPIGVRRIPGQLYRAQVRLAPDLVVNVSGETADEVQERAKRLRDTARRVAAPDEVRDAEAGEEEREPTPDEVRDVARSLAQNMADVFGVPHVILGPGRAHEIVEPSAPPEVGTASEVMAVAQQVADWKARRLAEAHAASERCPEVVTITTRGYVATTRCGLAPGHAGPHRDPLDVDEPESANTGGGSAEDGPREGEDGRRLAVAPCDRFRPFEPTPGCCWCGWPDRNHASFPVASAAGPKVTVPCAECGEWIEVRSPDLLPAAHLDCDLPGAGVADRSNRYSPSGLLRASLASSEATGDASAAELAVRAALVAGAAYRAPKGGS